MAKDPAFLFYSSDFLSGIVDLTMEERGQYITLLCLQHQKGHLPEKTIRLSIGSVSVDVLKKFDQDENGNFYNKRLDEEVEKRVKFSESRRSNGSKGGRPKAYDKPSAKPNGLPSENLPENRNENEDKDINTCISIALKDEKWVRINSTNEKELEIFKTKLEKEGIYYKLPIDFKSHFSRWKKKEPAELETITPKKPKFVI